MTDFFNLKSKQLLMQKLDLPNENIRLPVYREEVFQNNKTNLL